MPSRCLLICAFVPPADWAGHDITLVFQLNKHHHAPGEVAVLGEVAVVPVQLSSKDAKSCIAVTVRAYAMERAIAATLTQQSCGVDSSSSSSSSSSSLALTVTSYNILAQTFAVPETFCSPETKTLSKSMPPPSDWPLHRPHPALLLPSYRHPRIYADVTAITVTTVMMLVTMAMHVLMLLICYKCMRNAPPHAATISKFWVHHHAARSHFIIRQRLFKRCCRCNLQQPAIPLLPCLHMSSCVCSCSALAPAACCRFMLIFKLNSGVVNLGNQVSFLAGGKTRNAVCLYCTAAAAALSLGC